jgi:hypothetical protein
MKSKVTVEGKTYEFNGERFMNTELMAVERATGMTSVEWESALSRGSVLAATALVWMMRKRHEDPTLRFEDIEFDVSTLSLENEDDEEPVTEQGKVPEPFESDTPVKESEILITGM